LLLLLGTTAALLSVAWSADESAFRNLEDNNPQTRSDAIDRLVSQVSVSDLIDELDRDHPALARAGLAEAVRRGGVTATEVSALTGLLRSSNASTRYLAAGLLAPVASRAWDALGARAVDPDETTLVRAAAARTLAGAGPRAKATLRRLAFDLESPATIRHAAISALGVVDAAGVDDVRVLAEAPGRAWADRAQAIRALVGAGSTGETALVGITASKEARVRQAAAAALIACGNGRVSPALAGLLTDPVADVRYVSLQGLDVLGVAHLHRAAVIQRLADPDVRVQALAANLCGRIGASVKATLIPTLKGLLTSTSFRVRFEAALALKVLGDKSGAATMLTDRASTNVSMAKMAGYAYQIIVGS